MAEQGRGLTFDHYRFISYAACDSIQTNPVSIPAILVWTLTQHNVAMSLSEVILELLQKYGLSQRKLAEKSGVNYVTINRLLNDYRFDVTSETIDKLANGTGCTDEERYELHQAAGRVPEEVETKFGESQQAARLFRRITRMDTEEIEELLKMLEQREREK